MTRDAWAELSASLDAVRSAYGQSYGQHNGFAPGSPADLESQGEQLAGEWGQHPVRDANIMPMPAVMAVLDHLGSLSILFRSTGGITASHTVARSALDIAIAPWYLLDPEIDARERVRRYMNLRLQSLKEQSLLAQAEGDPRAERIRQHATERIEMILRSGRQHGFSVKGKINDRVRPCYLGPRGVPSTTELACEIVAPGDTTLGALMWRVTSAVAHGQFHGLSMFYEQGERIPDARRGDAYVRLQLGPQEAALRCGCAPLATLSLLRRLYTHYGWDTTTLEEVAQKIVETWQGLVRQRE